LYRELLVLYGRWMFIQFQLCPVV